MLIIGGIIIILIVVGAFKAGWDEQKSYENINEMAKRQREKDKAEKQGRKK